MPTVISGILKDGMGKPIPNCTIELKALRTSTTVITKTIASQQPEKNGSYSMNVELGKYGVTLCVDGFPPNYVGEIYVHSGSVPGTLNYYLGLPTEGDLPPAAIQQFEAMVELVSQQSEQVGKDKAAAAKSAADALASQTAAKLSETSADSSAKASKLSETNAGKSQKDTEQSAKQALASQEAAKLSETASSGSQESATKSAAQALASQAVAKTSETNAQQSADAAAASEKAAKLSETNAKTSETNAGESAAEALASEKAAKTSETNTAKGIEAAAASAQAAKLSENNADGSKRAAQTSAAEALASQGAAKTSETNAGNSAKAASSSADKAKAEADRATAATDRKQDENALLTAIAALNTAADQIITLTGKDAVATATLTQFAKEMLAKTDADGVREYLGLNEGLNLASDNEQIILSASGILSFFNYLKNKVNSGTGTLLSKARIYSEIRNDSKGYSTLETSANGKFSYLSHSEDGDLSTTGVITGKEVRARGGNYGGLVVGTYGGGNNRDITLNTAEGDPSIGAWVNLVQGNYGSNAFWQLGGVKNAVGVLDNFQFGLSNGVDLWRSFNFFPQYGGYLSSAKYKAAGVRTGWGGDGAYMESPFWVDNVVNNDDSWVPFIRGATSSTGGYATSASYGLISQGNANWPQAAIKLFGDGLYHRGFQFSVNGDISTWGDSVWGGNFIFTKSPNSDRDLKKSIEYNDGKSSYDRVMQYKPTTFVYKADKRERVRRGFIAQDLMQIDPEYVHLVPAAPVCDEEDKRDIENQKDDTLALDSNVLLLDGLQALRYMGGIIENQKNALAALEEKITTMADKLEELKKSKS